MTDRSEYHKEYMTRPGKKEAASRRAKEWRERNPEWTRQRDRKAERLRWSQKTPDEKTSFRLKKKYGLSLEEWRKMFSDQNHQCFLCDTKVTEEFGNNREKGVVDHCHHSGVVRRILCQNCNRALGLVKENKNTLERMIKYLEQSTLSHS